MTNVEASRVLVMIGSFLITLGLYDQALKIWRTRSAKDFTLLIVVALLFNELVWINYGLAIGEWPIYLISAVNLPAAVAALVGYLRYRKPQS